MQTDTGQHCLYSNILETPPYIKILSFMEICQQLETHY